MFLQYLSFLILFLGTIEGQQCCVSRDAVSDNGIMSVNFSTMPPDRSCSGGYTWQPCSSDCKIIEFTCSPGSKTTYAALCTDTVGCTYEEIDCPNTCEYSAGISVVSPDGGGGGKGDSGPMTTPASGGGGSGGGGNDVKAAAAGLGPASGSIAATLLASALTWFLCNHGLTCPAAI